MLKLLYKFALCILCQLLQIEQFHKQSTGGKIRSRYRFFQDFYPFPTIEGPPERVSASPSFQRSWKVLNRSKTRSIHCPIQLLVKDNFQWRFFQVTRQFS